MKNLFSLIIIGIFLISFTSAAGIVNQENNITVVCLNDGYCSSNAICNINIESPDNILIYTNQNMTRIDNYFNYNFTPEITGEYKISGFCSDGLLYTELDFPYFVSTTGEDYDVESRNYSFIIGLGIITILSLFLAWLAFKMKYDIVKIGILSFSVLLMIFNIGFTLNIMEDTLGTANSFYQSFSSLYVVAIALSVALAIGLIVWLIVIALKVYKMKRGIGDGLE